MTKMLTIFLLLFIITVSEAQIIIPLYTGSIPNSKPCDTKELSPVVGRVEGITIPTLTSFYPSKKDSNKTVVIICPGGGYARLAIDHEGYAVAKALNAKGISAFVLKYRNPIDEACCIDKEVVAFQDVQRAIQMVRDSANKWDINDANIGVMGFSAGGHLASTAGTHFKTTSIPNTQNTNLRPNFLVLIYPVITMDDSLAHKGSRNNLLGKNPSAEKINLYSNQLQVTPQTPPTFLLHALDDAAVKPDNSMVFFKALQQNRVPVEIHLLQKGSHGFGLKNKAEPIDWMQNLFAWMKTNNFIE